MDLAELFETIGLLVVVLFAGRHMKRLWGPAAVVAYGIGISLGILVGMFLAHS